MNAPPPPRRPRSRWSTRLLLIGGSALFTLVLCEVAARLFSWQQEVRAMEEWQAVAEQKLPVEGGDLNLGHIIRLSKNPRIVYEMIPNLKFRYFGADCATNSFGFRSPPVEVAKPADAYRVVVLGDSVAFGHGVAIDDAFPHQLELLLQAELQGRKVEVINTGVSGYNLAMEVATLVDKGLQFKPDLVVYHYVGNDLDLPPLIVTPKNFLTLRHSFLWEQMARAWAPRDPWTDRPWGVTPKQYGRN